MLREFINFNRSLTTKNRAAIPVHFVWYNFYLNKMQILQNNSHLMLKITASVEVVITVNCAGDFVREVDSKLHSTFIIVNILLEWAMTSHLNEAFM